MTDPEVFVYTGEGGAVVPQDVVCVRVDPSVTSIPYKAFDGRKKLAEVELSDGLVEIGKESFAWCDHSISKINIPGSLRRINDFAFYCSLQAHVRLHDDIESIGNDAFGFCTFTNLRVPPLITVMTDNMIRGCTVLFSLEISEDLSEIGYINLAYCYSLRNVAIPPNAVIDDDIFATGAEASDLRQLFGGSKERMLRELKHRFYRLPIHKLVYYHSYNQGVPQRLIDAIITRSCQRRSLRVKLDPTGNQQDCLGMTPLHILACSSVHDLELYRVIVDNYPANLVTKDRWGGLPLLYAFWGDAPAEIIQFLLDSYQSLYPDYEINWTNMVETMGRTSTPKERIENLLHVNQIHFPEQPIDWEYLLDEFVKPCQFHQNATLFQEKIHFLFMCGMSARVEALAFKVWRDHITNMIETSNFKWDFHPKTSGDNSDILHRIREKLDQFEDKLLKLKEVTSILEIVLWTMRLNEKGGQDMATQSQKKIKTEGISIRQQCRVTCGADIVIRHVMPYLISV